MSGRGCGSDGFDLKLVALIVLDLCSIVMLSSRFAFIPFPKYRGFSKKSPPSSPADFQFNMVLLVYNVLFCICSALLFFYRRMAEEAGDNVEVWPERWLIIICSAISLDCSGIFDPD